MRACVRACVVRCVRCVQCGGAVCAVCAVRWCGAACVCDKGQLINCFTVFLIRLDGNHCHVDCAQPASNWHGKNNLELFLVFVQGIIDDGNGAEFLSDVWSKHDNAAMVRRTTHIVRERCDGI